MTSSFKHFPLLVLVALIGTLIWLAGADSAYAVFRMDQCVGPAPIAGGGYAPSLTLEQCQSAMQFYVCANNASIPEHFITTRIVNCIEASVIYAVTYFMGYLSEFMRPTVGALCLLATIFIGIRVMAGEQNMDKRTLTFFIRLAVMVAFSYNLAGWATVPFELVLDALTMINVPAPWAQIDLYLGTIFGFSASGENVSVGLLGILGMMMFSSLAGVLCFLIGVVGVIGIVYFCYRAIFSYLAAVILIGYTIAISPLIIPLAIFQYTEKYFKKWLDLLIAAMLNPIMLFAFLYVFLQVFNFWISQIFYILGGPSSFPQYWRSNTQLYSWLQSGDPVVNLQFNRRLCGNLPPDQMDQCVGTAPMQSFLNPGRLSDMDFNMFTPSTVDFGSNTMLMIQFMVYSFIALTIVVYVMVSAIESVPSMSDQIAGVITGLKFERIPFTDQIKQMASKLKKAASAAGGGGGAPSGGGG